MKCWVISPNVLADDTEKEWKKRICDEKKVFIGWKDDNSFGNRFANEIQLGDLCIVAQGAYKNKEVYIAGFVSSGKYDDNQIRDGVQCRDLSSVLNKDELNDLNLIFDGEGAYREANRIPSLYKLKPDENESDKKIIDKIMNKIEKKKSYETIG